MCSELYNILRERDGLTHDEAIEAIRDAKQRVQDGEDPEEILLDDFGVELDYIFDIY